MLQVPTLVLKVIIHVVYSTVAKARKLSKSIRIDGNLYEI